MSREEYTPLPYIFDLMYDFKTVEDLHAHLMGTTRFSTSATDRDLAKLMAENDIPLPEGYMPTEATGNDYRGRYEELLAVLEQLHMHAKRHDADDSAPMDRAWVLEQSGKALAKQPGLTDEQRQAYDKPSPYLAK
jgi:hypothetical protein